MKTIDGKPTVTRCEFFRPDGKLECFYDIDMEFHRDRREFAANAQAWLGRGIGYAVKTTTFHCNGPLAGLFDKK